jgi:hypothetical protein
MMPTFDPHSIANLVGQLGGNHQQAAKALANLPDQQIDPSDPEHADMLQQMGVDPQQLQSGAYQQHLDNQNQPGFQGYQPGQDLTDQSPQFNGGSDPYGQGQQGQDQYGQDQYGQGQQGGQYGQGQSSNY